MRRKVSNSNAGGKNVGKLAGEAENGGLRLAFRGAKDATDAGLLAARELAEALGLTDMAGAVIEGKRTGRDIRHEMIGLLRQSVYARLAGYEDLNDHERLLRNPPCGRLRGRRPWRGAPRADRPCPDSRPRYLRAMRTWRPSRASAAPGPQRRYVRPRPRRSSWIWNPRSRRCTEARRDRDTTVTSTVPAATPLLLQPVR